MDSGDFDDIDVGNKPKRSLAEKVAKTLKKLGAQAYAEREEGNMGCCMQDDRGLYMCSRIPDHKGPHMAMIIDKVVHVWTN